MTANRRHMEAEPSAELPAEFLTRQPAQRVVDCYGVLDRSMRLAGVFDFTEGIYHGDETRPYAEAQAAQAAALVERTATRSGDTMLDIGCGYGRILREAAQRGITGTGITISPEQEKVNRAGGLDVIIKDYRHLDASWDGRFDGAVANGSIEHFVHPHDVIAGLDDRIYNHLFATVHRILRRRDGRFVTTVIHFNDRPDPRDVMKEPLSYPRGSVGRHWANLQHSLGGWYPVAGQLAACARDYFDLVEEEDGTDDYRLTSEYWLNTVRRRIFSLRGARIWAHLALFSLRGRGRAVMDTARCSMFDESWNWQFRGRPAPTTLLRQTWRRRP